MLYKHEESKKREIEKPIKKMSMEQKHKIRMLYFEEEKKLYEIKAREKMIKMVEKEQQHNLTIKTQLEKDKKILEQAKNIVISNMEQLKLGYIPNLVPLETLLDGTAVALSSEQKGLVDNLESYTDDSLQNRGVDSRTAKKDRKSEKEGKKKLKDKYDFR